MPPGVPSAGPGPNPCRAQGRRAADDAFARSGIQTGGPLDALAERHGLVPMTVTEVRDLTAPGHPRTKRFLRVALPEGVTYRTADHLTVLPANAPGLVDRAVAAFGLDADAVLDIRATRPRPDHLAVDRPVTVRHLLTHHVELRERPTGRRPALFAEANPCPPERAALAALPGDDPRTLLELAEDHPALRGALDWPLLLDLLPPLRLRHYSISSVPAADARHADLMVSVLDAPARSGKGRYRGTGSGHLASLRPGDTVYARVQPCREAFRIDHAAPVVMVAAGTGLAPFRGAVADRLAARRTGARLPAALLYFGCDAPHADYLHADELRAAERAGAAHGAAFVQHRDVCGDGARMAPGVRAAFRTLYRERTPGADEAAADRWLDALVADGRYVEDVYAAGRAAGGGVRGAGHGGTAPADPGRGGPAARPAGRGAPARRRHLQPGRRRPRPLRPLGAAAAGALPRLSLPDHAGRDGAPGRPAPSGCGGPGRPARRNSSPRWTRSNVFALAHSVN